MSLKNILIHLLFTKAWPEMTPVKRCQEAFLGKRSWEKRLRYAKLHKTWTKNQWQQVWWSGESLNLQQYVPNSWFGAAFQKAVLGNLSKLMEVWIQKSLWFWSAMQYHLESLWLASFFSMTTITVCHESTSPESESQYYWSRMGPSWQRAKI